MPRRREREILGLRVKANETEAAMRHFQIVLHDAMRDRTVWVDDEGLSDEAFSYAGQLLREGAILEINGTSWVVTARQEVDGLTRFLCDQPLASRNQRARGRSRSESPKRSKLGSCQNAIARRVEEPAYSPFSPP